jgi:hypothetical protein
MQTKNTNKRILKYTKHINKHKSEKQTKTNLQANEKPNNYKTKQTIEQTELLKKHKNKHESDK